MGCENCAMHNDPQQSEGPLRVNLFNFKTNGFLYLNLLTEVHATIYSSEKEPPKTLLR